jgi:hypothetical protein
VPIVSIRHNGPGFTVAPHRAARQQIWFPDTTGVDILTEEQDMYWRQMELTTIFVIWRERCRRIFAETLQDIPETAREIFTEYKQWFGS